MVPPDRSRSVATEVTRNITMSGKMPSSNGPQWSKICGSDENIHASSAMIPVGATIRSATVRLSCRS